MITFTIKWRKKDAFSYLILVDNRKDLVKLVISDQLLRDATLCPDRLAELCREKAKVSRS